MLDGVHPKGVGRLGPMCESAAQSQMSHHPQSHPRQTLTIPTPTPQWCAFSVYQPLRSVAAVMQILTTGIGGSRVERLNERKVSCVIEIAVSDFLPLQTTQMTSVCNRSLVWSTHVASGPTSFASPTVRELR
jgi:hypothetical protein